MIGSLNCSFSKESLLERREDVFDDVHEDFYSLDVIIRRFEEWRLLYPSAYSEAYIDLCLPRVFAPFIRLEMIEWNPLEVGLRLVGVDSYLYMYLIG